MNDSVDIDSLLDATLDDLADLPEFKNFPVGTHSCLATLEKKVIGDHPAVELTFKLKEHLELADGTTEEEMCKPDDTASIAFMLDNEFGQGKFKKVATVFGEALGLSNLGEIVAQVTDIDVVVTTNLRKDKKEEGKFYMGVVELAVV